MEFKDRLRDLRKRKKLTQKDLASILCYGYTAISNYESGRNEPSIADLKKIAAFFNVTLDYLLCVSDVENNGLDPSEEQCNQIYSLLTDQNQSTAMEFMMWLLNRQNAELQTSESPLKVAEEKSPYITKDDLE